MAELTNIFARSIKDLTSISQLPNDLTVLDQVKIPVGNLPAGINGCEALSIQQLKEITASSLKEELDVVTLKITEEVIRAKEVEAALIKGKADKATTLSGYGISDAYTQDQTDSKVNNLESKKANKVDVDTALSNLSTTANKYYSTLAAANADIANITLNQSVTIGEEANSGTWYKANSSATSLTKSPYDPLTQSQKYTDSTLADGYIKNYSTEATLRASAPSVLEMSARAEDTRRIWRWKRTSGEGVTPVTGTWTDTGLSDLELAKKFSEKLQMSHINDVGSVSNLFEFEDEAGHIVIRFSKDGDIENPNYSLNKIGLQSQENSNFISNFEHIDLLDLQKIKQNQGRSLYDFEDSENRSIVSFKDDGDIEFGGGRSLNKELIKSDTSKTTLNPKENVSSDFVSHLMNGMFWNGAKRSNLFVGAVKQNYHIKTATDFLNLRITEPSNPLIISTPYLKASHTVSPHSQVVHPFVCEFKDKPFGFKYILLATPFHGTNDQLENPTVWGSNDLQNFDLLNYFDQPLAHALPIERYNYNSDNFAVYDHTTGEFCVFYRNSILTADKTAVDTNRLYVRKTLDFVNWTSPELILKEDGDPLSSMMLSPNIIFNTALQKWQMFAVDWGDGIVDGQPGLVSGYSYRTSDYLTHGWSELHKINTPQGIDCWHQETRYAGSHFICIMNDIYSNSGALNGKGNLYLGISEDGENFDFSASVFSGNFNNPYKATITPELTKNGVKFNIIWTSNGNYHDGWKLYSTSTAEIGVK